MMSRVNSHATTSSSRLPAASSMYFNLRRVVIPSSTWDGITAPPSNARTRSHHPPDRRSCVPVSRFACGDRLAPINCIRVDKRVNYRAGDLGAYFLELSHHDLRTILQRLRQMCGLDIFTPCQIRDGACQFQDAMISTRRQI